MQVASWPSGAKEAEALRSYGVNITPGHMDGYYSKPKAELDTSLVAKPWESSVLEQMGPDKHILCDSVEGWNNEEFLFEIREGIAYCTLNRPSANNAMNDAISAGLHDAARILRSRPDIRVVVLTGNGRLFCAGGDYKAFQSAAMGSAEEGAVDEIDKPLGPRIVKCAETILTAGDGVDMKKGFARDLLEWASLPQFTICCLNGSAMGAGVGLVAVCDMVIAQKTAHISLAEVKLGVIPSDIAPYVVRTVGGTNAKQLFATADNLNMKRAMEIGLVQQVVSDPAAFPGVIAEVAKKIQMTAPGALSASKKALFNCVDEPICESMMGYLSTEYARVRKSEECMEGMKALSSKQRPGWAQTTINVKEVVA